MRIVDSHRRGGRLWILMDGAVPGRREGYTLGLEELLLRAADRKVDIVAISAGKPGDQSAELLELLRGLSRMGKRVELSISPLLPELIEETAGLVDAYVFNCDPEGEGDGPCMASPDFHRSLGSLIGKEVVVRRSVCRDSPGLDEVCALGEAVSSVASMAVLQQDPDGACSQPGSSEERMLVLGRELARHVGTVVLRGDGFRVELSRR